jgi:hypothetical protein
MKTLILSLGLLFAGVSYAVEEPLYKQHGDYSIFYSAFNSSFIAPDIAVANNTVSNILQQTQTLEFVAVREQNTVYYLAPFEFDNEDFLTFKIRVRPESKDAKTIYPYEFKFQKKMYLD